MKLTGHDGGHVNADPEAAARQACEIMLEATERALLVPDLPREDRARLLGVRRSLSRAVGARHLVTA